MATNRLASNNVTESFTEIGTFFDLIQMCELIDVPAALQRWVVRRRHFLRLRWFQYYILLLGLFLHS